MEGMIFTYYETDDLRKMTESNFEILALETYTEIKKNDSIYTVLRIR